MATVKEEAAFFHAAIARLAFANVATLRERLESELAQVVFGYVLVAHAILAKLALDVHGAQHAKDEHGLFLRDLRVLPRARAEDDALGAVHASRLLVWRLRHKQIVLGVTAHVAEIDEVFLKLLTARCPIKVAATCSLLHKKVLGKERATLDATNLIDQVWQQLLNLLVADEIRHFIVVCFAVHSIKDD